MQLEFYKYQGTGNDFVLIDNRTSFFPKQNVSLVAQLCNRRFGIGADGLILLENDEQSSEKASASDFRMVYYNADGKEGSMCGNGGRCLVAFAKKLNIINYKCTFIAPDGLHHATIDSNKIVSLKMIDVTSIHKNDDYVFMNTGSPHHVEMVADLKNLNVKKNGAEIRYGSLYGNEGSNINFVTKINENKFALRTYERGVEDETLACGTGATATAIAMNATGQTNASLIAIDVEGGKLVVSFDENEGNYTNVFLTGPAEFVFKGSIAI